MKIYTSPFSSNARRAELAAIELGVPYERVIVALERGEQRRPEFLALNPSGQVPVLLDDGFVLTESNAIMTYLAARTPGQTLYPQAIQARAQVDQWLAFSGSQWTEAIALLNWERFIKGMLGLGAPEAAVVARGEQGVRACVLRLDAHLAEHEFLVGEALSLADLAVLAPLMHEQHANAPIGEAKHLRRWQAQLQARPSWQQTEPSRSL